MANAPLDLFPRVLGSEWQSLPEAVQRCHRIETRLRARGHFTITAGKSRLARLLSWIMGMPRPGASVLTELDVRRVDDHLLWLRNFAGTRLATRMYLLDDGRIAERRGPLELCLRIAVVDSGIDYRADGARLCIGAWRIALPALLSPLVDGRAWVEPGAAVMRVRMQIGARVIGTIVTYQGPLEVVAAH
jgi:hypothetical protein